MAGFISERWRPHVLAATVHAIHGPQSEDALIFAQAREMLARLQTPFTLSVKC
jgi:hypothetical protein